MPGLYVHIPFCARRCPYCDFAIHVGATSTFEAEYCHQLRRELAAVLGEAHEGSDAPLLTSVFFGGGTPTALPTHELAGIMQVIRDRASLADDLEVSIEANPEGLEEAKLAALREAGWNRLSLGAQSFDPDALRLLGRRHRAENIAAAVTAARQAGFDNVSVDLIFAVPDQSRESWRDTLRKAIELEPQHVSCYSLTFEEGTPFDKRRAAGSLQPVVDDAQAELMQDACELLAAAGIERYEVSNYARPGYECRHNQNYWRGGDYLASGCGAHGHRGGHRWWNERSAPHYVELMRSVGSARVGEETLTPRERLGELVMLGLRTRDGVDLRAASEMLGIDARAAIEKGLAPIIESGLVCEEGHTVFLAPDAYSVADGIAVRLMPVC